MILVADASALIALATCKSLPLLDKLFGSVIVPEQVFLEVTTTGKPLADSLSEYLKDKIHKVDLENFVYLDAFADSGETSAMLLYKQLQADYLLIDDKRGRKVAAINKINTIGSMGVLLQSKRAGHIEEIAPLLDLLTDSPVYVGPDLIQTVLELAGE
jgi:predicted nucleic acid-binding protein